MTPENTVDTITVDQRRAIFKSLVESQDGGMSVSVSRAETAKAFSVSEEDVIGIEREGLEHQWPPL
ncbi:MAG TPA: hypothetical protein VGJ05_07580 [Fimbriiglobus sp.]